MVIDHPDYQIATRVNILPNLGRILIALFRAKKLRSTKRKEKKKEKEKERENKKGGGGERELKLLVSSLYISGFRKFSERKNTCIARARRARAGLKGPRPDLTMTRRFS